MMKKIGISLLVLIALFGVAVMTCPDKDAHKDALTAVIEEVIRDIREEYDDELSDTDKQYLDLAAPSMAKQAGWLIDGTLSVHNHIVCSTGNIHINSKKKNVTLGLFGHVFTLGKDSLKATIREYIPLEGKKQ